MAQPYIGEIRMFGGNFPPVGWSFCDGQLVAISENDTLYALIGTTYGGDGVTTFALPDLRGRVPTHFGSKNGQTYVQGQLAGVESVTLTTAQMPAHTHALNAAATTATLSTATTQSLLANQGPTGSAVPAYTPYSSGNEQISLTANSTTTAGGSQPHDNMQPYLAINFIISLYGIFPSQN